MSDRHMREGMGAILLGAIMLLFTIALTLWTGAPAWPVALGGALGFPLGWAWARLGESSPVIGRG